MGTMRGTLRTAACAALLLTAGCGGAAKEQADARDAYYVAMEAAGHDRTVADKTRAIICGVDKGLTARLMYAEATAATRDELNASVRYAVPGWCPEHADVWAGVVLR